MAFYLSPLVAVREIDLSMTIPAVATSIAAIVIRNPYKGPEMKQTFISTEEELISVFGNPTRDPQNYRDMAAALGYLRYGKHLYCTGVRPSDATFAGTRLINDGPSGFNFLPYDLNDENNKPLNLYDDFVRNDPDEIALSITLPDGIDLLVIAKDRGLCGNNLEIAICNREMYREIKNVDYDTMFPPEENSLLYQFGEYIGGRWRWTSNIFNTIKSIDRPLTEDNQFMILVREKSLDTGEYNLVELFNVSLNDQAIDDTGVTMYVENVINQQSKKIRMIVSEFAKTMDVFPYFTTKWEKLGGGSLSQDGQINPVIPSHLIIEGYDLYLDPEEIDVNIIIDGDKPTTVKRYIADFCARRMDCMAILDCMYDQVVNNRRNETMSLVDYRLGVRQYIDNNLNINTSYAAFYGNWGEIYDKYGKNYKWIPLSGHVAGVYAHTDWVADPWWAPAGLNRGLLHTVRRLAWNPSLGHRDMLYKNGINPIVSFPGQGKVIWGQKNLLDKPSAFNRVNVRRLFIVLEKAIATASKYFLFEPNDPVTRIQLQNMIIPFLKDVKARRGVYDFMVVCDETNNTPERIDRNELWCDIYIKPTRVAEFIILQFIATKTGVAFSESQKQIMNTVE